MSNLNVFSKSKQIKVLVCILGAGIGTAAIFMFAMLQYYNPSGIYFANNVLLSPRTFSILQADYNFKKNESKIAFDRFEFNDGIRLRAIDSESYFYFYDLVKNDQSIKNPENRLKNDFSKGRVAVLTLYASDLNESVDQKVVLTQIDFLHDDYYRVRLMESLEPTWGYFYHQGIYQTVINLFSGRHEEKK